MSSSFQVPPQASASTAGSANAPPLTPEQWRAVKEIIHDALLRPPKERADFVAAACGDDQLLRGEVDGLLAAARESDFLDEPVALSISFAGGSHSTARGELPTQLARAFSDRFTLERELTGGGMSRVFVAEERALGRKVVVKVLSPELAHYGSVERFAREVRFAARLQQANIVPVLNAGEVEGLAYYTMPYVRGESLRTRMTSGAEQSLIEALGILRDVAKALAYAHAEGVVHRDIKPENVLLSGGTAVVTDFGIAKAISEALTSANDDVAFGMSAITRPGMALGTPGYMAPEQAAGDPEVGPSADNYAFGIMAYELLAGRHPFAPRNGYAELMAAHILETPRSVAEQRPDLPPALAALVMRCLAKDPALRPANGRELLDAIRAAEDSSLGTALGSPTTWDVDLPSVAVLPLVNLSGDPDNEYFSDGIAAELLTALTHMPGVRVAARTSSFAFKHQAIELRSIAERLGVETLLEGTVRRSGNQVRIAVQLVSAADGLSFWSARYDRDLADIFSVQEEIAHSIAGALGRTLAGAPRARLATGKSVRASHAVNPDAFELYLRGRHLAERRTDGMQEALLCFEEAIRLSPDFSAPHAGVSMAFAAFGIYHALRPRDAFSRARDAADRALVLDPTDALALVMRAHTALWFEWQFLRAEELARRALELAPGLYHAHDCLGWVLAAQGRFEEAIAAMERARALDPLSEYSTYDLAWILILAGRWEQAIRLIEPAVVRHPQASELHRVFGFCLFYAGRLEEARAELRRVLELSAGDRWGGTNLVQVLAALGEMDEAGQLVREIEARAPHEPIPPLGIAIMHHWLGDDDTALRWLELALEARDYWLVMLPFDPSMIRLRGHPRFEAVMRAVRASSPP